MKQPFVFCLFALCFFSFPMQAENSSASLNVELDNKKISEVFDLITAETGYRFSYNASLFDANEVITLSPKNETLDDIIAHILPSTIDYKQKGNHIILFSKKEQDSLKKIPQSASTNYTAIENQEKIEDYNYLINSSNYKKIEKNTFQSNGISDIVCHSCVNLKNEEEMKHYLAAIVIAATSLTNEVLPQQNAGVAVNEKTSKTYESPIIKNEKAFQFGFLYPLGSDWVNSRNNSYKSSFNLIGGVTGRTTGFELGAMFNMNKYSSSGAQIAGAFNIAGYSTRYKEESNNFQIAGALNVTRAGYSNQIAGAANFAERGSIQIGGALNVASDMTTQIGGALNIAKKSATQVAGAANITKEGKVQIAGAVNVAKESKAQIAGALNVTGKGGFQLGVVNVRDTADGFSLGVVNIVKKGGVMEFGIEGGEFIHTAATFRSGVNPLYSIISFGYNFTEDFFAIGAGLGSSIRLSDLFRINLELMYYNLYDESFKNEEYKGLAQFRPLFNIHLAKHFKLYAGPNFNLLIQNIEKYNDRHLIDPLPGTIYEYNTPIKVPYSITSSENDRIRINFWIGITAGIKF